MSTKGDTIKGVKQVRKLGLDGMELEFVHSVNLTMEKAREVKKIAETEEVVLSCHAPYYVNLNSDDRQKVGASRSRIIKSAEVASEAGAFSVTFHPAFYMKQEPAKVYNQVKEQLKKIMDELKQRSINIRISPETTGKPTQFGSYQEIIQLSEELEQVWPCIDFAHLHARSGGKYNTTGEFQEVLELVEKKLGRDALDAMHMHVSGINYSEKGERNHLLLDESDMNYKDLLSVLKEFKVKGSIVCESPNIEGDAMLLKKTWQKI